MTSPRHLFETGATYVLFYTPPGENGLCGSMPATRHPERSFHRSSANPQPSRPPIGSGSSNLKLPAVRSSNSEPERPQQGHREREDAQNTPARIGQRPWVSPSATRGWTARRKRRARFPRDRVHPAPTCSGFTPGTRQERRENGAALQCTTPSAPVPPPAAPQTQGIETAAVPERQNKRDARCMENSKCSEDRGAIVSQAPAGNYGPPVDAVNGMGGTSKTDRMA